MELLYNWVLPPLAAFVISLFTSTAGISGAFLLLPFQVLILGDTAPSASATNQLFNVVASPGGLIRYYREGRLFLPLARLFLLATLPGLFAGVFIRLHFLADMSRFKFFAAGLLLFLACRMVTDIFSSRRGPRQSAPGTARPEILYAARSRVVFRFDGREYGYNVFSLACVTALIGLAGGIYGIGGAAILAPVLVSVYRLPVHVTAGATLFCTFVCAVPGVALYTALAPFYPDLNVTPDFCLGLLLGLGGLAGMSVGARIQKFLPPLPIKALLCCVTAATAALWLAK